MRIAGSPALGCGRTAWLAGLLLTSCLLLLWLAGCAPRVQSFGPRFAEPRLDGDVFVTRDGKKLPFSAWHPMAHPDARPRAVVVALHGFNMYRQYFDRLAPWLAERGIVTYAYDQRGFGGAPEAGIWGGADAMAVDAGDFLALVRAAEPGLPLHLLGVSMGGAVAILALTGDAPTVDSAILVAPAVWGGRAMNPAARLSIWLVAHTMPWNLVTGRGLRIRPTDNIEALRRLGRDPLVIKRTRMDAVYGVTNLMGQAYQSAPVLSVPALVLYGANDEIVPKRSVHDVVAVLPNSHEFSVYPDGWHMLLQDLQAEVVWRDIAAWIDDRTRPLPSAAAGRSVTSPPR